MSVPQGCATHQIRQAEARGEISEQKNNQITPRGWDGPDLRVLDPSLFPSVILLRSGCAQVSSVPYMPLTGWILPTGSSELAREQTPVWEFTFLCLSASPKHLDCRGQRQMSPSSSHFKPMLGKCCNAVIRGVTAPTTSLPAVTSDK